MTNRTILDRVCGVATACAIVAILVSLIWGACCRPVVDAYEQDNHRCVCPACGDPHIENRR